MNLARISSFAAVAGFWLAVVATLFAILSPLGYRLGWWDSRVALLTVLKWAAIAAGFAVLLSAVGLFAGRSGANRNIMTMALLGVLLGAVVFGYPAYQFSKVRSLPFIHDITTDIANPPRFVALAAVRQQAPNGIEYKGAEIAEQQKRAYPDVQPLTSALPPEQLFAKALEIVRANNWEVAAALDYEGRIEATHTSLLFAFKDDVAIRVGKRDGGSRLDMRSMSRVGKSDVGANAARIRAFMQALKQAGA